MGILENAGTRVMKDALIRCEMVLQNMNNIKDALTNEVKELKLQSTLVFIVVMNYFLVSSKQSAPVVETPSTSDE